MFLEVPLKLKWKNMHLNEDWSLLLYETLTQKYFTQLSEFVSSEYAHKSIYPSYENIFHAFNLLSVDNVKVVIVGQDPYHGENQANGLAFSVSPEVKVPPSLKNIYKELMEDIGCQMPQNGNLEKWSREGVLLINSVLTVEKGVPNAHKKRGWEIFTDSVIRKISQEFTHIVFILWGAPAQKKELLIDASKHLVLKAPHPSPLSSYRGFFGSQPFSKANSYLKEHNRGTIDWCLTSQQILL